MWHEKRYATTNLLYGARQLAFSWVVKIVSVSHCTVSETECTIHYSLTRPSIVSLKEVEGTLGLLLALTDLYYNTSVYLLLLFVKKKKIFGHFDKTIFMSVVEE